MTLPASAAGAPAAIYRSAVDQAGRSAANPSAAVAADDRWNRQTDGHSFVSLTLLRILCG